MPKSNFGSSRTAVDGNMYTMISRHGVVGLRLPAAKRKEFVARYGCDLFRGDPAWLPARELVAVPESLREDPQALKPHLERRFASMQTLKPKKR